MKQKIQMEQLRSRVVSAEDASLLFKNQTTIAMSGYASAGYPKSIPKQLVARHQNQRPLSFHLITGANVPFLDDLLAAAGMLAHRTPMCASRNLAQQINQGKVAYTEQQMCRMPRLLRSGRLGRIDYMVIEALGITKEGDIIPTTSVGMSQHLLDAAEKVVVEINTSCPDYLHGLHDIYTPAPPPNCHPIPLTNPAQRIGTPFLKLPTEKIAAIVFSSQKENFENSQKSQNSVQQNMIQHLFELLHEQYQTNLPPLQIGFGAIADNIAYSLQDASFEPTTFFCGGISQPVIELLASQKAKTVSAGGIAISPKADRLLQNIPHLKERLILRNGDITNQAETVGRMGIVALNTGIEVDLYGNVNASHVGGNKVVNGIGGGAHFAQNADLSVVLIPSTSKNQTISSIVPMVAHQDIGEHDVDVLITEHGVADLRGLDDRSRARAIISNCTKGSYQDQLNDYYTQAEQHGGHHPVVLEQAFQFHTRLRQTGSMLEVANEAD